MIIAYVAMPERYLIIIIINKCNDRTTLCMVHAYNTVTYAYV